MLFVSELESFNLIMIISIIVGAGVLSLPPLYGANLV